MPEAFRGHLGAGHQCNVLAVEILHNQLALGLKIGRHYLPEVTGALQAVHLG
jgi:hypothetical protein